MPDKPTLVKCLVWDLDNTLWQGTLLEDPDVELTDGVRDVIAELDARGILHSISSKNDYDLAWTKLEKLGLAEYFVFPQIGWGRKSDAVLEIAERLNFAPGTVAFIDDLPTERAEVNFAAPDVRCYPAERIAALPGLPEFSPAVVTVDARRRREMYQAGFRRDAEKESFNGPDEEFLRTLDLVMTIKFADHEDLSRVEELTLRTSQMNATGVHYSDATLRGLLADPAHAVLTVNMADRFGPHGAVGVMLLERRPDVWHLKLLATSCRVVAFGAGAVILNWLVDQAARAGAHLAADFRRTDRNRMMEIAYRFAGFTDDACACLAGLGPLGDGVQGLHLAADRRGAPTTMRLDAPELAAR
ncbi:HAD-IIIC family phosphatase [Actinomadura verrucosospora]|uniref:FkbH-like protein n=1 Tax=Actinomadura verrucosospora TaxID=46165 RepID=A0A7D3VP82_ACTVE|nr:HAD-IIIC family phosphatase [Actinomadura verrucosospora]QKG19180.1 FkbH-like protein [Actinomadura verrucosospora]